MTQAMTQQEADDSTGVLESGAETRGGVTSTCVHHPDRPAHALCMSCSRAVCQECATTWDGVNHCAACLARLGRAQPTRRSWPGVLLVVIVSAGLFWVATQLMVWTGALAASLL
jgi:hypothetical protein